MSKSAPSIAADQTLGCTCFNLRKLTRTVTRLYDQHLASVGLKTTQYSLLKNIAKQALPIATLATHLSIERTTLTRNLNPLLVAGWIELQAGTDSRQRIVTITAAGRRTIAHANQAWRDAQDQLEQTLGLAAVQALHAQVDSALHQLTPLLEEHSHAKSD